MCAELDRFVESILLGAALFVYFDMIDGGCAFNEFVLLRGANGSVFGRGFVALKDCDDDKATGNFPGPDISAYIP